MISAPENDKNQKKTDDFYQLSLFDKNMDIERGDYNIPFLTKFVPDNRSIRILDAGCGNGKYAAYLKQKGYNNLVAVDLFDSILYKEVPYMRGSIESLPFGKNEFDLIYSISVLYHLQKPENGIMEFSRVLKPGGILIFSGHTKYSLHTLWRRLNLLLKSKSFENLKGATFYTTKKYLGLLRDHHFEIIHVDGFKWGLILYPFYQRKIKWFEIQWDIRLPVVKPGVSKLKFIGRIKSVLAYHFVIVCSKSI